MKMIANVHKLYEGERIQDGDYWYYPAIDKFIRFDEAPRNWLGLRMKCNKHHAPIYRVVGLSEFK
jgi:hypothetical protein